MKKSISVITSTFNKSKYLDLTLSGFTLQDHKNFELVIVDDGGSDDTMRIVDKYSSKFRIQYVRQENTGIAGARNKALELAVNDRIVIIDDDRIPALQFLSEHMRTLDRSPHFASIGSQHKIISHYTTKIHFEYFEWMNLFRKHPYLLSQEECTLFTADELESNFQEVLDKFYVASFDPALMHESIERYGEDLVDFHFGWCRAFGGNLAFDRSSCPGLKYDTAYIGYGKEDVDLSYQLYSAGYHFVYTEKAANYHQEHPRNTNEHRQHYANLQRFMNKYDTLEMFLHELDQKQVITITEGNAILDVLIKYHHELLPKIHEFVDRIEKLEATKRAALEAVVAR